MAVRSALFVLTCLAFAGCTKTESQPTETAKSEAPRPAPVQRAPASADGRPAIVTLGDSLAEGFGVEPGQGFPDQLQRKLDSAGYAYRIVNLGVSGDTTTGGLGRIEYALSLKPAILILELGGNDGLRGIPVSATKQNLEQMILKARGASAEVLLAGMTLPPNYGANYIQEFEDAYKDLSKKYSLRLIPFLMEDIRSRLAAMPELMQRDGIHPSAQGHAIIADTVFRYLKPMLKKS